MFFKKKPNLPDGERARIEFHLQQIAECIGPKRFLLPVMTESELLFGTRGAGAGNSFQSVEQIKQTIGRHLNHDLGSIQTQTLPMQLQKIGGGG